MAEWLKVVCVDRMEYFSEPNTLNSPLAERRKRRQQRHQELFQFLFNVIQALSIGGSMIYYGFTLVVHKWTILQYFLFLSSFSFFGLWFLSRVHLGTHLTFRPKADRILVTNGLYKYFRHPIYYFGTLSLICYIMFLERYYLLYGLIILIPLQVVRALRENKVLKKKFEDDYEQYVSKLIF
jgi:protein-S-isoprenylcysteine O-methyltransferase Ste14